MTCHSVDHRRHGPSETFALNDARDLAIARDCLNYLMTTTGDPRFVIHYVNRERFADGYLRINVVTSRSNPKILPGETNTLTEMYHYDERVWAWIADRHDANRLRREAEPDFSALYAG